MKKISTEELRQQLEDFLKAGAEHQNGRDFPDLFNALGIVDCDAPSGTIVYSYQTKPWMSNVIGIVHGGVIATLLDSCMGITSSAFTDVATPTISMTINYAKPIPLDATVHVSTRLVRMGRTTAHVTAEIYLPERPDEMLTIASGVYSPAAAIAK